MSRLVACLGLAVLMVTACKGVGEVQVVRPAEKVVDGTVTSRYCVEDPEAASGSSCWVTVVLDGDYVEREFETQPDLDSDCLVDARWPECREP